MKESEAILSFIQFSKQLGRYHHEWQFHAILQLGAIACASEKSSIRQIALEQGIQFFMVYENEQDKQAWTFRTAALMGLIEVYQQFRSTPQGLLAREILAKRKLVEKHPYNLALLHSPDANIPQKHYIKQISFLPKYCCIALAEQYADTENDFSYLEKYIKSSEHLMSKVQSKSKMIESTWKQRPYAHLENFPLSTKPYHSNYKAVTIETEPLEIEPRLSHDSQQKLLLAPGEDIIAAMQDFFKEDQASQFPLLKTSKFGNCEKLPVLPRDKGTATRRKLFNAKK